MKYLITILFLLSTFAFGIEKKSPTGGTVKDKPGQNQQSLFQEYIHTRQYANRVTLTNDTFNEILSITLPKGIYEISASMATVGGSIAYQRMLIGAPGMSSINEEYTSNWSKTGIYTAISVDSSYANLTSVPGRLIVTSDTQTIKMYSYPSINSGTVTSYGTLRAIKIGSIP